ncbi:unnamed protein product, partial [Acanthocheilonema viteae]
GECQCPVPPPSPTPTIHVEETTKEEYRLLFCVIRPSQIDKYSRSIFPLIFLIFNVIYWVYYYSISGTELTDN